jgi:hypothetical protein
MGGQDLFVSETWLVLTQATRAKAKITVTDSLGACIGMPSLVDRWNIELSTVAR